MDGTWPEILLNLVRVLFGIFLGTAGVVGFSARIIPVPSRFLYGALSLAVVLPPETFAGAIYVNLAGVVLAVLLLAFDYARGRAQPAPARP
jgi:ABC-type cobalamin transport system permease subunit